MPFKILRNEGKLALYVPGECPFSEHSAIVSCSFVPVNMKVNSGPNPKPFASRTRSRVLYDMLRSPNRNVSNKVVTV